MQFYENGTITGQIETFQNNLYLSTRQVNSDIIFRPNTNNERMRITSTGNVGLKTATPTYDLSFDGQAARVVWMERETTSNTAGNNLTLQAGGATAIATDKNGGNLILNSGTSTGTGTSSVLIRTFPAGSTGTADNSPTTAVSIAGSGAVQMPHYGAGAATFDASGNISSASDERLKNVHGNFTTGLSALLQLKPILYKWNEKSGLETEHVYAGFSAQNVQRAIPEAVGQIQKVICLCKIGHS